jgi:hypothetical protein
MGSGFSFFSWKSINLGIFYEVGCKELFTQIYDNAKINTEICRKR